MFMHREILDLVLRGHERGPDYGLPLTYLEHQRDEVQGKDRSPYRSAPISQSFQARVIDGQLLLRSFHRMSLCLKEPLRQQFCSVINILCYHVGPDFIHDAILKIEHGSWDDISAQRKELNHCICCATDYRVQILQPVYDVVQVEITGWQQFGGRDPKQKIVQAMINSGSFTSITAQKAPARNLERTFNGFPAADPTQHREH